MYRGLDKQRIVGYDLLKIIAVLFVVVLHVNGYTIELYPLNTFSIDTSAVYYITQAITYPAIHLFVLIGSYFMHEKGVSLKNILRIWFMTFIVSAAGLIVVLLIDKESVTFIGLARSLLPFFCRAYWFVTDYIVLMLLAPFLSKLINSLDDKRLFAVTAAITSVVCILPTFMNFFDWSIGGNISLFVCLYFISSYFHRIKDKIKSKGLFVLFYFIFVSLQIVSVYIIKYVAGYISIFEGKEQLFYNYNSLFVIGSGFCLFALLSFVKTKNKYVEKTVIFISRYSLIIYLLHMHPIIKQQYTKWNILQFMNTQSGAIYTVQLILTSLIVALFGLILGFGIVKFADSFASKVSRRLLSKNKHICKLAEMLLFTDAEKK